MEQPTGAKGTADASWASSAAVRKVMQGNRSRDTRPEMAVRSAVHHLGLRYRVAARPLPQLARTADLVFRKARVAVFVDGCYWHACPEHHHLPRTNREYWTGKVARNIARDQDTNTRLHEAGWEVLRFWEHEDPLACAAVVAQVVGQRLAPGD